MEPGLYEALLREGWRRSGQTYYQNHCPSCNLCTPIRVPAALFTPTRSQRRVMRLNSDVCVDIAPTGIDDEVFDLYSRYINERHPTGSPPTHDEYLTFLGSSPCETLLMRYRVRNRLVGAGWVDVLPDGLSSVYYAFDPAESKRSLGTFSVTQEVAATLERGKRWLYLGFYVPGSRKMAYKANFKPHELAIRGQWVDPSLTGELWQS